MYRMHVLGPVLGPWIASTAVFRTLVQYTNDRVARAGETAGVVRLDVTVEILSPEFSPGFRLESLKQTVNRNINEKFNLTTRDL